MWMVGKRSPREIMFKHVKTFSNNQLTHLHSHSLFADNSRLKKKGRGYYQIYWERLMSACSVNSCQVLVSFCFVFGGKRLYQSMPWEVMSKAWLQAGNCLQPWRQVRWGTSLLKDDTETDLSAVSIYPTSQTPQKCFKRVISANFCLLWGLSVVVFGF